MRKKIVAGNWKMNKTFQEAEDLIFEISDALNEKGKGETIVIVCPPAPYLEMATDIASENDFFIGAQNAAEQEFGAYTGEISATMIQSMGVQYVILGHSERRQYFGETDSKLPQRSILHLTTILLRFTAVVKYSKNAIQKNILKSYVNR